MMLFRKSFKNSNKNNNNNKGRDNNPSPINALLTKPAEISVDNGNAVNNDVQHGYNDVTHGYNDVTHDVKPGFNGGTRVNNDVTRGYDEVVKQLSREYNHDEPRDATGEEFKPLPVPDVISAPLKFRRHVAPPLAYLHGDQNIQARIHGDQNTQGRIHGEQNTHGRIHGDQNTQDRIQGDQNTQGRIHGDQNTQGRIHGEQNTQDRIHGDQNTQGRIHGEQNTQGRIHGEQNTQGRIHGDQNTQDRIQGDQNTQGRIHGDQNTQGRIHGEQNTQDRIHGDQNTQGRIQGDQNIQARIHGDQNTQDRIHGEQNTQGRIHGDQNTQGRIHGDQNTQGRIHGIHGEQNTQGRIHGDQISRSQRGIQGHHKGDNAGTGHVVQKSDEGGASMSSSSVIGGERNNGVTMTTSNGSVTSHSLTHESRVSHTAVGESLAGANTVSSAAVASSANCSTGEAATSNKDVDVEMLKSEHDVVISQNTDDNPDITDLPPPPTPDVAKSSLLRHLGLLLGDDHRTSTLRQTAPNTQNQTPINHQRRFETGTSIFEPVNPGFGPGIPIFEPVKPVLAHGAPVFEPVPPGFGPEAHVFEPVKPVFEPGTPVSETQTSRFKHGTPVLEPRTPLLEPVTPKFDRINENVIQCDTRTTSLNTGSAFRPTGIASSRIGLNNLSNSTSREGGEGTVAAVPLSTQRIPLDQPVMTERRLDPRPHTSSGVLASSGADDDLPWYPTLPRVLPHVTGSTPGGARRGADPVLRGWDNRHATGTDVDLHLNDLAMTYNPTFSPGNHSNVSADSVTSLISTSTGHSVSPPCTWSVEQLGQLSPMLYRSSAVNQTIDQSAFIQRPRSVTASRTNATGDFRGDIGTRTPQLSRGVSEMGGALSASRDGGLNARRSMGARRAPPGVKGSARLGGVGESRSIDFNGKGRSQLSLGPVQPCLTRLMFEVVQPLNDPKPPMFSGRDWVFQEIVQELMRGPGASRSRGVVLIGSSGSGKTSIIQRIISKSEFCDISTHPASHTDYSPAQTPPTSLTSSQSASANLFLGSSDSLALLADRVVAFHICQADNNITCTVPEFVHSVAAHLAQSSYLRGYGERLQRDEQLRSRLTMSRCISDLSRAFIKGVIEPLNKLRLSKAGRGVEDCVRLLLVDGLDEAAYHEPDYGGTIASFLADHMSRLPAWLKVIVTVRSGFQDSVQPLGFNWIKLDGREGLVHRDVSEYVLARVSGSSLLTHRISDLSHSSDPQGSSPGRASTAARLAGHIASLSNGSMLYAKCVLDSIERGPLVLKGTNYKSLPVSLSEIFLMKFSVKYPTTASFDQVSAILNICLASLYPLTALEIYETLCAGSVDGSVDITWAECSSKLDSLADVGLIRREDTTYMFFHPAFRDWLLRRDPGESNKYICDLRHGHTLLALRYSRQLASLTPERVLELGHHILKAHIYRAASGGARVMNDGKSMRDLATYWLSLGVTARDLTSYWLCLSADSFSPALVAHRNLFTPNVKVSRLILLSGASANARTDQLFNSPILCVASYLGHLDLVSLLVEFGADLSATGDQGVPALSYAAQKGHIKVIHLLVTKLAKVNQMDFSNQCPLVHAASNGQLDACSFLLQCDWSLSREKRPTRNEALQQSLVAAAANGHINICNFLMGLQQAAGGSFNVNKPDSLLGETALTAACSHGHSDTVTALLRGVPGCDALSLDAPNSRGQLPLVCAAASGHRSVIDRLLHPPRDRAGVEDGEGREEGAGVDRTDGRQGRTALMVSAAEGHHPVTELLLDEGASVSLVDKEGLTALSWACLKGHIQCVRLLVEYGSSVEHRDKNGRTPLHLAASYGDEKCVEYLIERGSSLEEEDDKGLRALDRAISSHSITVVSCFLRRGAKLGPCTWQAASGQPDMLILLFSKLIDDGNTLYKRGRIKEAGQRYTYALRKFPSQLNFNSTDLRTLRDIKVQLLLNLSRCRRKLNDTSAAIELSSSALEVKPRSSEALYSRARAKRDERQFISALADLEEALKYSPDNVEIIRLIQRIHEESGDCRGVPAPPGFRQGGPNPLGLDETGSGASSPNPSLNSACFTTTPQLTNHRTLPTDPANRNKDNNLIDRSQTNKINAVDILSSKGAVNNLDFVESSSISNLLTFSSKTPHKTKSNITQISNQNSVIISSPAHGENFVTNRDNNVTSTDNSLTSRDNSFTSRENCDRVVNKLPVNSENREIKISDNEIKRGDISSTGIQKVDHGNAVDKIKCNIGISVPPDLLPSFASNVQKPGDNEVICTADEDTAL